MLMGLGAFISKVMILEVMITERTVSFHNFESRNFKLSVSNPKSKYVAYVSVLSQISNCQSLGRKNNESVQSGRGFAMVILTVSSLFGAPLSINIHIITPCAGEVLHFMF